MNGIQFKGLFFMALLGPRDFSASVGSSELGAAYGSWEVEGISFMYPGVHLVVSQ